MTRLPSRSIALVTTALALACSESPTAPRGLRGAGGVMLVTRMEANHSNLYAVLPDGSKELRLTNDDFDDTDPAWSPDGRQILFVSNRDTVNGIPRSDIWIMEGDGSGQRRLYMGAAPSAHPRFSPDGRSIVFGEYQPSAEPFFHLYVMHADGSAVSLLAGDGLDDTAPEWSPDGKRILFLSLTASGSRYVSVMNADGTGARRLSTDAGCAGQVEDARWSPDGSRIVYSCGASYGVNIYVMNADGTGPVALTPPGVFGSYYPSDIGPVWSPNGDRIAFSSPRGTFSYQAFVMPASGGIPAQVTNGTVGTFVSDWGPPSR